MDSQDASCCDEDSGKSVIDVIVVYLISPIMQRILIDLPSAPTYYQAGAPVPAVSLLSKAGHIFDFIHNYPSSLSTRLLTLPNLTDTIMVRVSL